MSRADLEAFLRGAGHTVDARTDINGRLRVVYLGSSDEDNDYDAYEIIALQALGQDTQPLARTVWKQLHLSDRWAPREIRTDDDPPVRSRDIKSSPPHARAIITVDDTHVP